MREIARTAGVAVGGLYPYFGSACASSTANALVGTSSSDFSRARSPRPHGEVSPGAFDRRFGRPVRRYPRSFAARLAHRQSRSLSRRCLFSSSTRSYRLRAPRRKRLRSIFIRASKTLKADHLTPLSGHKVLANSHGFVGEYRRSYCSHGCVPIARTEDDKMQRDYWFSVARTFE